MRADTSKETKKKKKVRAWLKRPFVFSLFLLDPIRCFGVLCGLIDTIDEWRALVIATQQIVSSLLSGVDEVWLLFQSAQVSDKTDKLPESTN